jgi:hypothetical protein
MGERASELMFGLLRPLTATWRPPSRQACSGATYFTGSTFFRLRCHLFEKEEETSPFDITDEYTAPIASRSTFRDHEAAPILETLRATGGIIGGPQGAAVLLGLKRTTLVLQNEEARDLGRMPARTGRRSIPIFLRASTGFA